MTHNPKPTLCASCHKKAYGKRIPTMKEWFCSTECAEQYVAQHHPQRYYSAVADPIPPDAPLDYEGEVRKRWPNAIQNRSFLSPYNFIVYDGDEKHGMHPPVLGSSEESYKSAWQDAYSKLEPVAQPEEGQGKTLIGRSRDEWVAHIDELFRIAHPGEDIPEAALLFGWQGTPTAAAADFAWAKEQIAELQPKAAGAAVDGELPPLVDSTRYEEIMAQITVAKEYETNWDGLVERVQSNPNTATDVLMDLASTEASLQQRTRQLLASLRELAALKAQESKSGPLPVPPYVAPKAEEGEG